MNKNSTAMAFKGIRKLLFTAIVLAFTFSAFANTEILDNAPKTYVVKKRDTLWDIASLFLEKPWLWPELWRKNTQIENPHLIYPGDIIKLRYVDGEPVFELVREKNKFTIKPGIGKVKKDRPIDLLPWTLIAPYIDQNLIVNQGTFDGLPKLLGNKEGNTRFVDEQIVLSELNNETSDQFTVVRKDTTIKDMNGKVLGIQLRNLGEANLVAEADENLGLVKVNSVNEESKPGDKLITLDTSTPNDLVLKAADQQKGFIVDNLHQRILLGKYDIVVIDLGEKDVTPGTVMGIYMNGPDIINGEEPKYDDESATMGNSMRFWAKLRQPGIKVGEIIVFNTFENASYGIITRASDMVTRGAVVANP